MTSSGSTARVGKPHQKLPLRRVRKDALPDAFTGQSGNTDGMNRTRLSTTGDAESLDSARSVRTVATDAAVVEAALRACTPKPRNIEQESRYCGARTRRGRGMKNEPTKSARPTAATGTTVATMVGTCDRVTAVAASTHPFELTLWATTGSSQ